MVFDIEPMVFPSSDVGGEFVGKIFVTACCLSWMPAPPTTDGFLEVGGGLPGKDPNGVQFQGKLHKSE
jgi:hypothetical protein